MTLSSSPTERLSIWQRESGTELPARATVVDGRRDKTTSQPETTDWGTVSVRGVPEDGDLYDIGLTIASQLGAWKDTDERSVMCLHSVTTLLASFDIEQVVGLITALNDLCEDIGVVAHHHVDSEEHDEETTATLRPLYDAVIEHTPDDGWIPTERERSTTAPTFRSTTSPPGGTGTADPDRSETVPMRHSFETVLDLVSSPRRRTLLYNLKSQPTEDVSLDRLVEEVHNIDRSLPIRDAPSREKVRIEIVHVHLPMLQDAGIIQYDTDTEMIQYTGNQGLEAFLRYIETIELG
ncbi:hypothetical protein DM2_1791 [Halorubrum sp. DM2]|uniref:DUF7504 family protein n=1 Tax=Halorubrum sp. DM2 TaxID=2527867 RepID=UPI000693AA55|nr:hypothetical protein [Halorubrum sp. DM2]VTT85753.1 hypothetical protein DM2_1791 [Halorubrum sp. DM2]